MGNGGEMDLRTLRGKINAAGPVIPWNMRLNAESAVAYTWQHPRIYIIRVIFNRRQAI
jgi:hypothetical protein